MEYYIDVLPYSLDKEHPHDTDDKGVLLSRIPYTLDYGYHTTAIASHVIAEKCTACLGWLLDNMDDNGCYRHDFVFPWYPMRRGWIGGLAQGLAASALARMGYEKEAAMAVDGLVQHCHHDGIIYEYPGVEILNGWMYGIFGVMDVAAVHPRYQSLVERCREALIERIPRYDLNGWTAYDQTGIPSTPFYHRIHMKQFAALGIYWFNLGRYPRMRRLAMLAARHHIRLPIVAYKRWRWKRCG